MRQTDEHAASEPGATVGRYQVVRRLAVGGMAEVYLARALGIEGFEKPVVLKRIRREFANDGAFIRMLLDEARIAALLQHPNIAQVFDVGLHEGVHFLAMEYVEGEDLRSVLKDAEGRLPLPCVLAVGRGVASALHYAHERERNGVPLEIVHRDVTPSNVVVTYEGGVKLVDFGIARARLRTVETIGPVVKGKARYMSPEQCRAEPLDRRSDLFSLGAVLYEMTSGLLPFDAPDDLATMNLICTTDARPPSTFVPEYPKALERIVMTALKREKERRYASARELLEALDAFAQQQRISGVDVALSRHMQERFGANALRRRTEREQALAETSHSSPTASMGAGAAKGGRRLLAFALGGAAALAAAALGWVLWPRATAVGVEPQPVAAVAAPEPAPVAAPPAEPAPAAANAPAQEPAAAPALAAPAPAPPGKRPPPGRTRSSKGAKAAGAKKGDDDSPWPR